MPGPLEGVRVIDLTSVVLGPYATMLMGDMGADVIKVEAPAGDTTRTTGPGRNPGMACTFLTSNRNKRSIVLDLKQESAREALRKLLDSADVFVHSIRPQAVARLGFSPEEVLKRNPRIVYAAIHGFGEDGPYAGRPAYDDIIQSICGLAGLMERRFGEPLLTPMITADKTCGITALYSILAALFNRERTGRGQFVEIPMLEVMTQFTMLENLYGHTFDPPEGPVGYPRVLAEWRRPCQTQDGWITVLAYTDRQWERFVTEAGRPELAEDPRYRTLAARTQHIEDTYVLVAELLRQRTTEAWIEALDRLEIPCARVNRLEELEKDPHLSAVGFFRKMEHPTEGPLTMTAPPVKFAETPAEIRTMAPLLGQHSAEILREAGLTDAEIVAMTESGATATA